MIKDSDIAKNYAQMFKENITLSPLDVNIREAEVIQEIKNNVLKSKSRIKHHLESLQDDPQTAGKQKHVGCDELYPPITSSL